VSCARDRRAAAGAPVRIAEEVPRVSRFDAPFWTLEEALVWIATRRRDWVSADAPGRLFDLASGERSADDPPLVVPTREAIDDLLVALMRSSPDRAHRYLARLCLGLGTEPAPSA
jgi:hypothetical protein